LTGKKRERNRFGRPKYMGLNEKQRPFYGSIRRREKDTHLEDD